MITVASILATPALSVTLLYLALFLAFLLSAVIVIDSGFVASTIGTDVSAAAYLDIAWLAGSMGTVAGALGSNFDADDDIRNFPHVRRQAQRFQEREGETKAA